jgi:hypothetical protein
MPPGSRILHISTGRGVGRGRIEYPGRVEFRSYRLPLRQPFVHRAEGLGVETAGLGEVIASAGGRYARVTILRIGRLLTLHFFLGMLLTSSRPNAVPPAARGTSSRAASSS